MSNSNKPSPLGLLPPAMSFPPTFEAYFDSIEKQAKEAFETKHSNGRRTSRPPVDSYLRTASKVLAKGRELQALRGDLEEIYILLYRYALLIGSFLPRSHPDWNTFDAFEKESARKTCAQVVDELEQLKPQLRQRYERVKAERLSAALNSALNTNPSDAGLKLATPISPGLGHEDSSSSIGSTPHPIEKFSKEYKHLSVLLELSPDTEHRHEQEEIHSTEAIYPTSRAIRAPPVVYTPSFRIAKQPPPMTSSPVMMTSSAVAATSPASEPQMRLVATYQIPTPTPSAPPAVPDNSTPQPPPQQSSPVTQPENPQRVYATADNVTVPRLPSQPADATPAPPQAGPSTLSSAPAPQSTPQTVKPTPPSAPVVAAALPPSSASTARDPALFSAKAPPSLAPNPQPTTPQPIPVATPQPIARPTVKPAPVSPSGLRQIVLYAAMFSKFMEYAEANTSISKETCGVLAGYEAEDGSLHITTLIIPKQTGSTDSCATTHEDEIFLYQEKHGLLTFGWVHTHPNHDLFMSSVDLHTHHAYQSMIREAIAIVIAPLRSPNFGIFRLTEPEGMYTIQNCKLRGFHPHYQRESLYKVSDNVKLIWGEEHSNKFNVVDQR